MASSPSPDVSAGSVQDIMLSARVNGAEMNDPADIVIREEDDALAGEASQFIGDNLQIKCDGNNSSEFTDTGGADTCFLKENDMNIDVGAVLAHASGYVTDLTDVRDPVAVDSAIVSDISASGGLMNSSLTTAPQMETTRASCAVWEEALASESQQDVIPPVLSTAVNSRNQDEIGDVKSETINDFRDVMIDSNSLLEVDVNVNCTMSASQVIDDNKIYRPESELKGSLPAPAQWPDESGEPQKLPCENPTADDLPVCRGRYHDACDKSTTDVVKSVDDGNLEEGPREVPENSTVSCTTVCRDQSVVYFTPQENESGFSVHDLVWGKVRSHPWWPGQIFDPSDASEAALKHKKDDRYLVAYFGDHTFAWTEASQLRPFFTHFAEMEKQSSSASFTNAVDCALDEAFRRVELSLTCRCIPRDVYGRFKGHLIENAGIRHKTRVSSSAHASLAVALLEPAAPLQYIKDLCLFPFNVANRLELAVVKAHLFSFSRSKGHPWLPVVSKRLGTFHSEVETAGGSDMLVDKPATFSKRQKLDDGLSSKRKRSDLGDVFVGRRQQQNLAAHPGTKEKFPTLSLDSVHSVPMISAHSTKRKKATLNDTCSPESSPPAKKSLNVGECIRKIAGQLTQSTPDHEYNRGSRKKFRSNWGKAKSADHTVTGRASGKARRKKLDNKPLGTSAVEMLTLLCFVAQNPLKKHKLAYVIISFFTDYRDQLFHDNCLSEKQKKKLSENQTGEQILAVSGTTSCSTSVVLGVTDSYWTDRVVYGSQGELPAESILEPEVQGGVGAASNGDHRLSGPIIDKYSPTALILNFKEPDALPSVLDVNTIFSSYGPLEESETRILLKDKRAIVVFKRRADAEAAFSSTRKFDIFRPSLLSYQLRYQSSFSGCQSGTQKHRKEAPVAVKECKLMLSLSEKIENQTESDLCFPPADGSNQIDDTEPPYMVCGSLADEVPSGVERGMMGEGELLTGMPTSPKVEQEMECNNEISSVHVIDQKFHLPEENEIGIKYKLPLAGESEHQIEMLPKVSYDQEVCFLGNGEAANKLKAQLLEEGEPQLEVLQVPDERRDDSTNEG